MLKRGTNCETNKDNVEILDLTSSPPSKKKYPKGTKVTCTTDEDANGSVGVRVNSDGFIGTVAVADLSCS